MFRKATILTALLLSAPGPALADECLERFIAMYVGALDRNHGRAHIVTEIKGQPRTENVFEIVAWDHTMTRVTVPAGSPWVLTRGGTTWQSSDEGATWTKVREFDAEEARAAHIAMVKAQADTASNVVCGEEAVDGVTYETMSADLRNETAFKYEMSNKYWIDPASGQVVKSTSHVTAEGFESFATQTWEFPEGLELPVVE